MQFSSFFIQVLLKVEFPEAITDGGGARAKWFLKKLTSLPINSEKKGKICPHTRKQTIFVLG